MTRIDRQPDAFAEDGYDLIVVGGGIYGAALLYEASRRGLRALLLEQNDFGSGVSGNSLRIVHGGLRYLQNMELRRHRESVRERRWHLQQFPDLVAPLKCMMPLYGKGLKRPNIFRAALAMNDAMSFDRNRGVREDRHLPAGRIAARDEVHAAFDYADKQKLRGAGVWHDAVMLSSERVLIELIRHACANGGRALNYHRAVALEQDSGSVSGVRAVDSVTGSEHAFRAPRVINCAGPWCRHVASSFDRDAPELYRKSLAFNLLFDRPAVSDYAVAVEPPIPDAKAYFIVPWKGKLLLGTRHTVWDGDPDDQRPSDQAIDAFIHELNLAMPGIGLQRGEVRRVYAGMLPALKAGEPDMAHEPVFVDHAKRGGPAGLFSVSGVKWTTARGVAEQTLRLVMPKLAPVSRDAQTPGPVEPAVLTNVQQYTDDPQQLADLLGRLVADESAVYLDDLVLRRMDGLDADDAMAAVTRLALGALDGSPIAATAHGQRLVEALSRRQDAAEDAVRAACAEHAGEHDARGVNA